METTKNTTEMKHSETNTRNFNTVNELSNELAENKTATYIDMAREFAKEANIIAANNEDSFIVKMATKEVIASFRKAEAADCEYTAYVNANHAEKWLEKVITGKL